MSAVYMFIFATRTHYMLEISKQKNVNINIFVSLTYCNIYVATSLNNL
jgi:hypothetical protein